MKHVNRVFAVVLVGFAAWYANLAFRGFAGAGAAAATEASSAAVEATPGTFAERLASAGRPAVVDCWASWCKNCAAMERVTMSDPKVKAALGRFTLIRLQAEDINELRRLPGFEEVKGLPAFAVFE